MTVHILFDANPLLGNKSGVGNFTERLLTSLASIDKDTHITAYYFNFLGMKKGFLLPDDKNISYKVVRFFPTKLLSALNVLHVRLPIQLFVGWHRYDFIIYPNFVSMPSIRKTPTLVAVHDLGFLDCPEYVHDSNRKYLARSVPMSVKNSTYVLTISEFTKSRLGSYFGKQILDKTFVIPIPYEPARSFPGAIDEKISVLVDKPYLLYMGTIEPRKNIDNLILGFLKSSAAKTHRLILAGGMGWKTDKIDKVLSGAVNKADIVTTGYINDAERDFLYKNCTSVCLVSHYEGFGMPILEAFHYKKPLLLSSIDVFHEVAGDAATYCSPTSISSIAAGIDTVISQRGTAKHPMSTSWEEISKTIIRKIREAIHE